MEHPFTEILLIRHGDAAALTPACFSADKNLPDPDLTALGRHQAGLAGRRLASAGIGRIWSRDLKRAAGTAEAIGRHADVAVELHPAFREIDMGRLHHCGWADILREDPDFHDRSHSHLEDLPYPGGESGGDVRDRAMKALLEIAERGPDRVAVVTHGDVIRVLVCAALGIGQEKRFLIGPPENTSITTLRYYRKLRQFTVYALNDAGHLNAGQTGET